MNQFLEHNNWFDLEFRDDRCGSLRLDLGLRYPTFRIALNLLIQSQNPYRMLRIVETGTVRQADDWSEGRSTYVFGKFLAMESPASKLITIDINPKNMDVSKLVTAEFSKHIEYIVGDSVTVLNGLSEHIDLLYLDSFDVPEGDATECQAHNLNEFKAAEPNLSGHAVVLLDDNNFDNGGKPKLTKQYLASRGWTCLMNSQQSLWIKR
jgi:predicted O-methyltransferase YrrM